MPGFEVFGEEERKEVQEVLETGVLFRYGFDQARKGRWKARRLEEEVAARVGAAHCHVCSSGTGALSTALAACGIGAGDEVIVPPFTFIATIEAVLLAGAVPVFAEIDKTLCLDPESVESAITPRTRAVLPVHMCGSMARIDELENLCRRKGLHLIEDACQAFGATYRGKALGTFGRVGCYSFDAVKTITCGEGGALVTNDPDVYQRAERYADHGHDHVGNDRGLEGHPILGTNFRISELNAAVGLAQLRKLDWILEKQRFNKSRIKKALESVSGVTFRQIPDEEGDSATFLSFFLPGETDAREAAQRLAEEGVDGTFYWYDNNWHYFRKWDHLKNLSSAGKLPLALLDTVPDYRTLALPQSDGIMKRTISLLIKVSWSEEELEKRSDKIQRVLGG
ncbi:MAG: DegT/DnrJ/EryC1/StrS family aminotransferase [Deltaproteobacteria bacterium]|nr:DegT/DnrJ/EryC1/StrS family aminotransferase [Deltaproteobacteria bacterium]MBW2016113.1 DegT/DnrJ/EryC1/StrS family aminotransferase [Deltaproteobacteria bacterium]MBW2128045.1 DegT/DnrJ/EryC1/StrS family aminotransferase [Deltaproteobacteria bacterium]